MAQPSEDYRSSAIDRKQRWHGLKKPLKRLLAWRVPHFFMRVGLRFAPDIRSTGRLPAPAHLKEVVGSVQDRQFVMLRPADCVVAKELYWGAGRRPRPEDDFAVELFAALAQRADVMLDIGAYTGIFTLVGTTVNPQLEAHAFEFLPDVYTALFENCVRNDVLSRVTLHHVAIGDPTARPVAPVGTSDSALPSFYSPRMQFSDGVVVRSMALDRMATFLPSQANVLIKIDVEGSENEVLRYGQELLRSFRPDMLCEVLAGVGDGRDLQQLLDPHGYRYYLVRGGDIVLKPSIEPDQRFRDWLFSTLDPAQLRNVGRISVVEG